MPRRQEEGGGSGAAPGGPGGGPAGVPAMAQGPTAAGREFGEERTPAAGEVGGRTPATAAASTVAGGRTSPAAGARAVGERQMLGTCC